MTGGEWSEADAGGSPFNGRLNVTTLGLVLAVVVSVAFLLTLIPQVKHARLIWDFVLLATALALLAHVA